MYDYIGVGIPIIRYGMYRRVSPSFRINLHADYTGIESYRDRYIPRTRAAVIS